MVILFDYLYWHYSIAPARILVILNNYLIANWNRFLITRHLKTLFYPWHRSDPSQLGRPANIGEKIMDGIIDFYIRLLAAFIRLIIIFTGLFCAVLITAFFLVLLIFWILWPLIFILAVIWGINSLAS